MFRRRDRGGADRPGSDDLTVEDDQDFPGEAEYLAEADDAGDPGYADDPGYVDDPGYADDSGYAGPSYADDTEDGESQDDREAQGHPGEPPRSGRHRQVRADSRVDLGDPDTWTKAQQVQASRPAGPAGQASGPWDGAAGYPDRERLDFGSLLVPAVEGFDIQINVAEEQGIWIAVVRGDSALQLQAFAAPKTSGLWDEVRRELAEEVAKAGGDSEEASGPFGPELHARVSVSTEGQGSEQPQPLRFLGANGPRWFLRGMITGPAALPGDLAADFESIFADVVVVRGGHPAPPGDQLVIQLPEEARRALEEQAALDPQDEPPNPFERGPEITETR